MIGTPTHLAARWLRANTRVHCKKNHLQQLNDPKNCLLSVAPPPSIKHLTLGFQHPVISPELFIRFCVSFFFFSRSVLRLQVFIFFLLFFLPSVCSAKQLCTWFTTAFNTFLYSLSSADNNSRVLCCHQQLKLPTLLLFNFFFPFLFFKKLYDCNIFQRIRFCTFILKRLTELPYLVIFLHWSSAPPHPPQPPPTHTHTNNMCFLTHIASSRFSLCPKLI